MKKAISNIAWPAEDIVSALSLLRENKFRGLEVAPGLLFPDQDDPFLPSKQAVDRLRSELSLAHVEIISMQSLLFGVNNAFLFGTHEQQSIFLKAMRRAIGLAERLQVPNIVFGSPRNRAYSTNWSRERALDHAAETFHGLGGVCAEAGVVLALEPNPAAYGTNLMTTALETFEMCQRVAHSNVKLNFDLGSLHMNEEFGDSLRLFDLCFDHVSHIHISEPNLAPAPENPDGFFNFADGALKRGYRGWFSIEMKCPEVAPMETLEASLKTVNSLFGEE